MNDRPLPALLAAALVLAGCGGAKDTASSAGEQSAAIPVAVSPLLTSTFTTPLELSGSLTAVRSVTVGAVSPGRVVSVDVRVGDRVAAGTVLARVDASGYEAGLAQAQAGVMAASQNELGARAQVSASQSRFEFARTTAGRMAQLYTEGAISKQQRDEAQANLDAAAAGLRQAQAALAAAGSMASQAHSGVEAAGVPLRNTSLSAPFDGIVTSKFVEPGAVVGPGSPIVGVQNTHDLELDVAIPNDDLAVLSPGDAVKVSVGAAGGRTVPAHVRAIVPMENAALRSALVKIALDDRPGLLPGMFARVSIEGGAHEGWAVPLPALVTRAGQDGVFVVRRDTASFVPVQTGSVGTKLVEVRGVEGAGTEVAVSNLQRLTDRAAVSVIR